MDNQKRWRAFVTPAGAVLQLGEAMPDASRDQIPRSGLTRFARGLFSVVYKDVLPAYASLIEYSIPVARKHNRHAKQTGNGNKQKCGKEQGSRIRM